MAVFYCHSMRLSMLTKLQFYYFFLFRILWFSMSLSLMHIVCRNFIVLYVLRQAILSSMPQRSMVGTPVASQSDDIGN